MARISFVTTTWNGVLTLNRALSMACHAGADELCVCDNGSSDGTGAIIAQHDAKSVRFEENQGPVAGMNAALELATGDYVFYHGDDDWLTDGALTRLANTLDENPAAHFAYGGCKFWGLRSDVVLPVLFTREDFHQHMAAVGFAVMWRRDDTLRFRDVNPADWDFMLQMTEERQWVGVAVPEITINYTLVAGRTWYDMKRNESELLAAFKARWPMVSARGL